MGRQCMVLILLSCGSAFIKSGACYDMVELPKHFLQAATLTAATAASILFELCQYTADAALGQYAASVPCIVICRIALISSLHYDWTVLLAYQTRLFSALYACVDRCLQEMLSAAPHQSAGRY